VPKTVMQPSPYPVDLHDANTLVFGMPKSQVLGTAFA